MAIYRLGEHSPEIHPTAFIAESANIIGNVKIKAGASVWFGVTIRADNDEIVIGENSNIQDCSMLHADPGFPIHIGNNVTVGHHAILHGCTVGDGALIGIRSTVLNGAVIGANALVGACALVTEGKSMEANAMILGVPAKVTKIMDEKNIAFLRHVAEHYVEQNQRFTEELEKIG